MYHFQHSTSLQLHLPWTFSSQYFFSRYIFYIEASTFREELPAKNFNIWKMEYAWISFLLIKFLWILTLSTLLSLVLWSNNDILCLWMCPIMHVVTIINVLCINTFTNCLIKWSIKTNVDHQTGHEPFSSTLHFLIWVTTQLLLHSHSLSVVVWWNQILLSL